MTLHKTAGMICASLVLLGASQAASSEVPQYADASPIDTGADTSSHTAFEGDGEEEFEGLIDELFLGETAYPEEQGSLEVTLSASFFDDEEAESTQMRAEFFYGVTDRFRVSAEVPYLFRDPKEADEDLANGFGDIEIGFLYNLAGAGEDDPAVVSAALEVGFPTGNEKDELGEGEVEWEPSMRVATDVGSGELFATVGGSITRDDSSFVFNIAFAVPVGPVIAVLELDGSEGDEDSTTFVPGVVWDFNEMEMGVGIPLSVSGDDPDWGVIYRVTREF